MNYRWLRRAAFRIEPERAHAIALRTMRIARPVIGWRDRAATEEPVEAFGLHFPNPLGLAAGYDKDGSAWRSLAALGFGHIEIGTVTPGPQPGNPAPRIFRIPEHESLVNRMGFPSLGAEAVAARLQRHRPPGVVLGVSIGPNAATPPPERIDDYVTLVDRFAPLADYLAVNVSSPNTTGLRTLETAGELRPLLAAVSARRHTWQDRLDRAVPILVKLSPDIGDPGPVIAAIEGGGADGVIVGNTTTTRPGDVGAGLEGGLSGRALGDLALERLQKVVASTRLPVVACGGISSGADAARRMDAGAALVQIYTGLVYEGPGLVRRIVRHLSDR